jgi:hypothetical protein
MPTVAASPDAWLAFQNGDSSGRDRAGVRDNLDLFGFLAEPGQDDVVEHVALEKWASPTHVLTLVV